jgi:hypothetical protein
MRNPASEYQDMLEATGLIAGTAMVPAKDAACLPSDPAGHTGISL